MPHKDESQPIVRYRETFDEGPNGWFGFVDNFQGEKKLIVRDGSLRSYSPWWVDYNHAPPTGAGYLQLLAALQTRGPFPERLKELAGDNRFAEKRFPTDFRDARITLRLKGELELRGAQLVLLLQARGENISSGWMLTGQPIKVTPDWSDQSVSCVANPSQWTPLGTRPDRADFYGTCHLITSWATSITT